MSPCKRAGDDETYTSPSRWCVSAAVPRACDVCASARDVLPAEGLGFHSLHCHLCLEFKNYLFLINLIANFNCVFKN